MNRFREWLKGKKTYFTGVGAIITAITLYAAGDCELGVTMQTVFGACMGMFMRADIQKTENAAKETE